MKKMNKKGFTLIELLAIIVILAIIAVITVPIILNIIDEARKGAEKNSVIGYGKAVELAYTQYQFEKSMGTADADNTHIEANTSSNLATNISNGKTIKVLVGTETLNLKVDFDGDKVTCTDSAEAATANTITDGKVVLKTCKVNGATTPTYNYAEGKATKNS